MSYPAQAFGASGIEGAVANTRPMQVRFTVAGTIKAGAVLLDQAAFFNRDADVALSAGHALATTTPAATLFTAAQVSTYFTHNPAQLANIALDSASSAAVLSSMVVSTVRNTPDGKQATEEIQVASSQTSGDFVTTRAQVPLVEVIDGYTFIRLISDAVAVTAATYSVTFTFGAANDRRLSVPITGPKVIVSPK